MSFPFLALSFDPMCVIMSFAYTFGAINGEGKKICN